MPGRVYIIPAGMDYQSRGGEGSAAQSYSILPNRSLFFREGVAKQLGSFPIAATHMCPWIQAQPYLFQSAH